MKRFARLFRELDSTTRTSRKISALAAYFREAEPEDAAWVLAFLSGRRIRRAVKTGELREWAAEESGLAGWLVEECYHTVGDLAETLALLVPGAERADRDAPESPPDASPPESPPSASPEPPRLAELVESRLVPLASMEPHEKRRTVVATWRELDADGRFLWNKLVTGGFRVGVARRTAIQALAEVSGIDAAVLEHRTSGDWKPSADAFRALLSPETGREDARRPYPFCLAYPLEDDPGSLGAIEDWQAEWKWDGIRAQILRRGDETIVWSRGEELVTDRYPEVVREAAALPDGTALDGELLAWREGRPLEFGELQRRIGRKTVGKKLLAEVPVAFLAYDLLEADGEDLRDRPLAERRERLEAIVGRAAGEALRPSPIVAAASWRELAERREESRDRRVEGFMLKRRDAPYAVGRKRGPWWKWKVAPHTIDAVLLYAQRGHGRRAGLYTDYTFGVWDGEALVPVAKAYSGLTDAEIRRVDRWIRTNTTERFGPVRAVPPELVFELAFEGIRTSTRHKSGIAVRFPRMARWRQDKAPEDADRLEDLRALLR